MWIVMYALYQNWPSVLILWSPLFPYKHMPAWFKCLILFISFLRFPYSVEVQVNAILSDDDCKINWFCALSRNPWKIMFRWNMNENRFQRSAVYVELLTGVQMHILFTKHKYGYWLLYNVTMLMLANWPRSVSLHGLLCHGWAVVDPRRFHFTIIAFGANQGRSSRGEISWIDLWQKWHPMTLPCVKSLRSSVRLFCMFVCVLDFMHLLAPGVAETRDTWSDPAHEVLISSLLRCRKQRKPETVQSSRSIRSGLKYVHLKSPLLISYTHYGSEGGWCTH